MIGGSLLWRNAVRESSAPAVDSGTPQYQADEANTGYVRNECPPTANVQQEWEIDDDVFDMSKLTLTAADDSIYVVAVQQGVLVSVTPGSGSIQWRWQLNTPNDTAIGMTSPAIADGTVYLGTGRERSKGGMEGDVYAIDAASGSTQWSTGVGSGLAYVTVVNNTVYTGSEGALYALNAGDGSRRWATVPDQSSAAIEFPAVADGTVVYTTDAGGLYALAADTGNRQWKTNIGATTAPSIANGLVYLGRNNEVRALKLADGTAVWKQTVPDSVPHPPVVADGRVFVFVEEETSDPYNSGVLTALEATTGASDWEYRTPGGIHIGPLPPLAVGDTVLVVGNHQTNYDNSVFIIDRSDGTLKQQIELKPEPGTSAPVVHDGTLVAGHNSVGFGFVTAWSGDIQCGNSPDRRHTLMITSNGPTQYEVTVDGTLSPDTEGGSFSSEQNDTPTQNSNGTLTVSDETGPAPASADGTTYYGDRFLFSGDITTVDVTPDDPAYDVTLYIDEQPVTKREAEQFSDASNQTHTCMITSNGPTQYEVTVDGTLSPDTEGGSFSSEQNDAPTQNSSGMLTVSDKTGPAPSGADGITYYGDRFLFSGDITTVDVIPDDPAYDVHLYIDEQPVTQREAEQF